MEIWKDIDGCNGRYQISTNGRVKSFPHKKVLYNGGHYYTKERILKPGKDGKGYRQVFIGRMVKVHRLVAMAFLDIIVGKNQINHIDGNKDNNRLDNLEWCNGSENVRHAVANGLINPFCKLTKDDVSAIRLRYSTGTVTTRKLASEYGVAPSTIYFAITKKKRV